MSIAKLNGTFIPTTAELNTIRALTVGNATPNELRIVLGEVAREVENPAGAAIGSEPTITTILS